MNTFETDNLIKMYRAGYKLVPVPYKSKHPILKDWRNAYFRTEVALREYLHATPKTNMAIIPLDDWIVLDIDRHNGDEDYSEIQKYFIPTFTVKSGGNGQHYYYKCPKNFNQKLRRKIKGYNTIEIQTSSMCLIAPGSTHPNGNKYVIAEGSIDEIVEIPPILLKLCIDDGTADENPSRGFLTSTTTFIPTGSRNITLTSVAGKFFAMGLNKEQVLTLIKKVNEEQCDVPLPEKEIEAIVNSVSRYDNYNQKILQNKNKMNITEQIDSILNFPKIKPEVKKRRICVTIIKYLINEGYVFYKANDNFYILDSKTKKLIWLDRGNRNFKRLIYSCGINPASDMYNHIFEALCAHCDINGDETEVYKFAHVDTINFNLYIKTGIKILKISPDSVQLCDNGTDKVMFADDVLVESFEYIPNLSEDYMDKYLFNKPNYNATSYLSPEELKTLCKIYFLAMFMPDFLRTKPIISTVGAKGSGKTSLLRMMIKCLYGRLPDVLSMTNKLEDLDTIAAKRHVVFIDNLDTYKDTINDKLATYATGITNEKRRLYSNGEVYREKIDAFIGISTRNPVFRRDDVAQRVLIIYLDTLKEYKNEAAIIEPIIKHRNEILSQVIDMLQIILKRMKEEGSDVEYTSALRMSDFAHFTALYFGNKEQAETLLKKVSKNQKALATEGDILFTYLTKFVSEVQDDGWYNAKTLYRKLDGLAAVEVVDTLLKNDFRAKYDNPVSLAKRLQNIKEDVAEFIKIDTQKRRGNITFYRITAGENFKDWEFSLL